MVVNAEKDPIKDLRSVEQFREFLNNPGEPLAEIEMTSDRHNIYTVGFYNHHIEQNLHDFPDKIEGWFNIPSGCFSTMNSPAHGEKFKKSYIATTIDRVKESVERDIVGVFSQFDYEDIENSLMIVRFQE